MDFFVDFGSQMTSMEMGFQVDGSTEDKVREFNETAKVNKFKVA